jgi:GH15 family glucan-1,4-alpha-glucosidase
LSGSRKQNKKSIAKEEAESRSRSGRKNKAGPRAALNGISEDLDASLLIMPLVFFMAPKDQRMLSTIDAILKTRRDGGLLSDSLVYRYPPQPRIDGLPGEEGTFNMCSFWLVEALTRAGKSDSQKLDQARLLFERVLGYANHLGLYSEQTGPQGEALGNFPQAFAHLAFISDAFKSGPNVGEPGLNGTK